MAAQEVDRYTYRLPGQATAYYYGLMKMQTLRMQAEVALGEGFDQLAFHDFILAQGLLPPELLKKAVLEEFIPQVRSQASTPSATADDAEQPTARASTASADVNLGDVKSSLTTHIEETLADRGIPSISIALMKDDRLVWTAAFGLRK